MSATRRGFLQTVGLGALSAGCLESRSDAYQEAIAEIPDDPTGSPPTVTVDAAHWFPANTFAPVTERLSAETDRVEVEWERFSDRRSLERAVADRMVAGRPPDLIQTGLGAELRQYVAVSVFDPLPASTVEGMAGHLADLCGVDADPYAAPITHMPMNCLAVETGTLNGTERIALEELNRVEPIGIRRTSMAVFHLFCLMVLAAAGPSGYRGIGTGELAHRTIVKAARACGRLDSMLRWLPPRPDAADVSPCGAFLVDPVSVRLLDQGWEPRPFPETGGVAVLHATGLARPSRTRNPHGAFRALEAAMAPPVQSGIAARAGHLPAVDSAAFRAPGLADRFARAETILPAMSTGCGLDPDRRWLVGRTLAPARMRHNPDAVGDALSAILR